MTAREHYELVFIASRMEVPVLLALSGKETDILVAVCNHCHAGCVSDIWGVHDHGQCRIEADGKTYFCHVNQLLKMIAAGGEYERRFDNSTTPPERDFLVYVLAKRTNQMGATAEDIFGMVLTCCSLCRQGVEVLFDPTIHNHGDCSGSYDPDGPRVEANLELQCWVHRFWHWLHDTTRMESSFERV